MPEWSGKIPEKTPFQNSLLRLLKNKSVISFQENSRKFVVQILTNNLALNCSGAFFFIGIGYSLKWLYKDQFFVTLLKQNLPALCEPQQRVSWETSMHVLKEQNQKIVEKQEGVFMNDPLVNNRVLKFFASPSWNVSMNKDLEPLESAIGNGRTTNRDEGVPLQMVEVGKAVNTCSVPAEMVEIANGGKVQIVKRIDLYTNHVGVTFKSPWEKHIYQRFVGVFAHLPQLPVRKHFNGFNGLTNQPRGSAFLIKKFARSSFSRYTLGKQLFPEKYFKLSARGFYIFSKKSTAIGKWSYPLQLAGFEHQSNIPYLASSTMLEYTVKKWLTFTGKAAEANQSRWSICCNHIHRLEKKFQKENKKDLSTAVDMSGWQPSLDALLLNSYLDDIPYKLESTFPSSSKNAFAKETSLDEKLAQHTLLNSAPLDPKGLPSWKMSYLLSQADKAELAMRNTEGKQNWPTSLALLSIEDSKYKHGAKKGENSFFKESQLLEMKQLLKNELQFLINTFPLTFVDKVFSDKKNTSFSNISHVLPTSFNEKKQELGGLLPVPKKTKKKATLNKAKLPTTDHFLPLPPKVVQAVTSKMVEDGVLENGIPGESVKKISDLLPLEAEHMLPSLMHNADKKQVQGTKTTKILTNLQNPIFPDSLTHDPLVLLNTLHFTFNNVSSLNNPPLLLPSNSEASFWMWRLAICQANLASLPTKGLPDGTNGGTVGKVQMLKKERNYVKKCLDYIMYQGRDAGLQKKGAVNVFFRRTDNLKETNGKHSIWEILQPLSYEHFDKHGERIQLKKKQREFFTSFNQLDNVEKAILEQKKVTFGNIDSLNPIDKEISFRNKKSRLMSGYTYPDIQGDSLQTTLYHWLDQNPRLTLSNQHWNQNLLSKTSLWVRKNRVSPPEQVKESFAKKTDNISLSPETLFSSATSKHIKDSNTVISNIHFDTTSPVTKGKKMFRLPAEYAGKAEKMVKNQDLISAEHGAYQLCYDFTSSNSFAKKAKYRPAKATLGKLEPIDCRVLDQACLTSIKIPVTPTTFLSRFFQQQLSKWKMGGELAKTYEQRWFPCSSKSRNSFMLLPSSVDDLQLTTITNSPYPAGKEAVSPVVPLGTNGLKSRMVVEVGTGDGAVRSSNEMIENGRLEDEKQSPANAVPLSFFLLPYQKFNHHLSYFPGFSKPHEFSVTLPQISHGIDTGDPNNLLRPSVPLGNSSSIHFDTIEDNKASSSSQEQMLNQRIERSAIGSFSDQNNNSINSISAGSAVTTEGRETAEKMLSKLEGKSSSKIEDDAKKSFTTSALFRKSKGQQLNTGGTSGGDRLGVVEAGLTKQDKAFFDCNKRKIAYNGVAVQRNTLTKDLQPYHLLALPPSLPTSTSINTSGISSMMGKNRAKNTTSGTACQHIARLESKVGSIPSAASSHHKWYAAGYDELRLNSIWGTLFLGSENPLTNRQCHFFGQRQLSPLNTSHFQRDYLRQLGKETIDQANFKGFPEKVSSIERAKILSFSKRVNSFFFKKRKYTYLLEKKDQWHLLFQEQLRAAFEDSRKYPPLSPEEAKENDSERIKISAPLILVRFPILKPEFHFPVLRFADPGISNIHFDTIEDGKASPIKGRYAAKGKEVDSKSKVVKDTHTFDMNHTELGFYAPSSTIKNNMIRRWHVCNMEKLHHNLFWRPFSYIKSPKTFLLENFVAISTMSPIPTITSISNFNQLVRTSSPYPTGKEAVPAVPTKLGMLDSKAKVVEGLPKGTNGSRSWVAKLRWCNTIGTGGTDAKGLYSIVDGKERIGNNKETETVIFHYPLLTERPRLELNNDLLLKKNIFPGFRGGKVAPFFQWLIQERLTINSWSVLSQWFFLLSLLFWIEQTFLENVFPALFALEQALLGGTGLKVGDRAQVVRISKGTRPTFQDLAGIDGLLGELSELVLFLRGHKEHFWNKKSSYGVLLTGPPGTGKTFLVRALANEAGVPVLILSVGNLVANKVNSNKPSWSIRHAFRRAKQLAPCILFIDEIDALGKSRGKIVTDINEVIADTALGNLSFPDFSQSQSATASLSVYQGESGTEEKEELTKTTTTLLSRGVSWQNWPAVPKRLTTEWTHPLQSTIIQESNDIAHYSLCEEKLLDLLKIDRTGQILTNKTNANDNGTINPFSKSSTSFTTQKEGISNGWVTLNKQSNNVDPTSSLPIGETGDNEKRKFGPLTQLLLSMDGVSSLSGILIMGATNRPELLDSALIRPGRFERTIRIEKPSEQKRIEILQLYSRNLGVQQQIPWSYLANRTKGLTVADLAVAMNYSSLKAILQKSAHTIETIEYGLDSITRSFLPSTAAVPPFVVLGTEQAAASHAKGLASIPKAASSTPCEADEGTLPSGTLPSSIIEGNNHGKVVARSFHKLAQIAYYQAGKIVTQTLLPYHPPVAFATLNSFGITSSTSVDTHIPNTNASSTQDCSSLEDRLIGLYGGKAALQLFEYQHLIGQGRTPFFFNCSSFLQGVPQQNAQNAIKSNHSTVTPSSLPQNRIIEGDWQNNISLTASFAGAGNNFFQSNIGNVEIQKATQLASIMVNALDLYSFNFCTPLKNPNVYDINATPSLTNGDEVHNFVFQTKVGWMCKAVLRTGNKKAVSSPQLLPWDISSSSFDQRWNNRPIFGGNDSLPLSSVGLLWKEKQLDEKYLRFAISQSTNCLKFGGGFEDTFPLVSTRSAYSSRRISVEGGSNFGLSANKQIIQESRAGVFQLLYSLQISNVNRDRFYPGWFRLYLPDVETTEFQKNVSNSFFSLGIQTFVRPSTTKSTNRDLSIGVGILRNIAKERNRNKQNRDASLRKITFSYPQGVLQAHFSPTKVENKVGNKFLVSSKREQGAYLSVPSLTNQQRWHRRWSAPSFLLAEKQLLSKGFNVVSCTEKELISRALVNNSFTTAFLFINKNRQLLDYFADCLIRFQILRQHQILFLFSAILLNCKK